MTDHSAEDAALDAAASQTPAAEGSGGPKGRALLRAVEVMDALRAPDGDAWTHRQTHASLSRYLLEETHEVLEVLEDPAGHAPGELADELGDLLFQILFHAKVGEQDPHPFDIDDVAHAFIAKMERRNPHIFGPDRDRALEDREDIDEIIAQWHRVKAEEAAAKAPARSDASPEDPQAGRSVGDTPSAPAPPSEAAAWFASIPALLPALHTAAKVVHRARSDGRLEELLAAARNAAAAQDAADWGGEQALALLELVVETEAHDTDPESALRTLLRRTERALS